MRTVFWCGNWKSEGKRRWETKL